MSVFATPLGLPGMTFVPANPGQVDIVYARVRDAILRGDMEPDEAFGQERVARDLNVSHTPLREALRMLEREGLVQSSANRSYRVTGFALADMEQIYVVRAAARGDGAPPDDPADEHAGSGQPRGCMAQMDTFAKAQDYEHWEVPHRAFHAGLVAKSGQRIARLAGELSDHAERYRRFRTVGGRGRGPRASRIIA